MSNAEKMIWAAHRKMVSGLSINAVDRQMMAAIEALVAELNATRDASLISATILFGVLANTRPEGLPDDAEELARWLEVNAFHLLGDSDAASDIIFGVIREARARDELSTLKPRQTPSLK